MSNQDNGQVSTLQRPISDDPETWKSYWKAQGCAWRTEPEINAERQKYLAERRAIVPDIEKGIYPFRDIKLSRADVEWLLVTHESGRGPVDWSDEKQREREGLDLRGTDLHGVDLSCLPLTCLRGGAYPKYEWLPVAYSLSDIAGVRLEDANLSKAHLEGANFIYAHLERSDLSQAYLEEADLRLAHLEKADLYAAHLEGSNFYRAHLEAVNLSGTYMTASTKLREITLGNKQLGFVLLSAIHWDDVDLSVVNWTQMHSLGNEYQAPRRRGDNSERKDTASRLLKYQEAVRANRRLAVALQSQGLNEEAARFAYRAQLCQRIVLRLQKKFGQYLFSLLLDLLAGYGYRPGRSVIWYLATILVFGLAYHFLGGLTLYPPDAFVFSVMSFHGRGFFPALSQETNLHNPLVMLAALEAIIGLLIEISFIATFTQRFFGR